MGYDIKSAAVIGAGVMGAGIAAHLANCGLQVLLLDQVPVGLSDEERASGLREDRPEWRNRIALQAVNRMLQSPRPVFVSEKSIAKIEVGNTEDDINKINKYDWIIETIIEDLELKRILCANIERYRHPGSVVTTNTSGLPISCISRDFSEEMKEHFLGMHFFNPPTFIPLLELIPGQETSPELMDYIFRFCRTRLGKKPLIVKDTPNFIANRLAIVTVINAFRRCKEKGITVEEADALCGKSIGRHQAAIFATADAVGLDTVYHVTRNLKANAAHDELKEMFFLPAYIENMISQNLLGNKSRGGFYKVIKEREKSQTLVLDLDSLEYRPRIEPQFPCLQAADKLSADAEKVNAVVYGTDRGAQFAWDILADDLIYAANRLGEIADTIVDMDNAMQWGYTWRLGPFMCWDAIGLRRSVERMKSEGRAIPSYIEDMLGHGYESFYSYSRGQKFYFDFRINAYQAVEVPGLPICT